MTATPAPEAPRPETVTSEPGRTPPRLWEAVGWCGTGLVAGTVLLAFLVLWHVEGASFGFELLLPEQGRGVWQLPLLIAVVVAATVFFRDRSEPNPEPAGPVNSTFSAFLGVTLAILLLVMWTHVPRGSFEFTAQLFGEQYNLSPREVERWGVSVPLLLGIVLLLVSRRWPRTGSRRRWLAPFAVGVVLALLAGALVRVSVQYRLTEHVPLAGEAGEPAAVPERVTRVGWTWDPPEEVGVRSVEPGSHGPIVVLDDGVVALDGLTGEELWVFRHPHNNTEATVFAEEGVARVAGHFLGQGQSTGADGEALVTDLDTVTGEIVEQSMRLLEDLEEPDDVGPALGSTPDLTVYTEDSGFPGPEQVIAREGVSGEELWTYGSEDETEAGRACEATLRQTSGGSLLHGDQILLPFLCADSAETLAEPRLLGDSEEKDQSPVWGLLVSLDLGTGARNWSYEWEDIANDGWIDSGGPVMNEDAEPVVVFRSFWGKDDHRLLDPRDGTEIGAVPEGMTEAEFHEFDLLTADTGGMVLYRHHDDGTLQFLRATASGEIVDTAEIPGHTYDPAQEWTVRWRTTVLEQEVVLPGVEGEHPDGVWGARFALTAPFGQDSGDAAVHRIPVGDELELPWHEHQYGRMEAHMAPLPLPGSVVVHTTNGEGTHAPVHGLVP